MPRTNYKIPKNFFLKNYLLVCLVVSYITLHAQEKQKSVEVNPSVSYLKIRDNNFSPTVHKGTLFTPKIGFASETSGYLDRTSYQFTTGNIELNQANPGENSTSNVIGGAIDWIHVRKLHSKCNEKVCISIGGVWNNSFIKYKREYPESDDSYYLFQSSLGPAIHLRNRSKLNQQNFILEQYFTTALICYAVYPSYSSYMPDNVIQHDLDGVTVKNYLFGGKVLAINKYQRLFYSANLGIELSKKTTLKVNYTWEFINIVRKNNYVQAGHHIGFSLNVLLK